MIPSLDRFWARLRAVFTSRQLDHDFTAELQHHLEALTADNVRAGMTPSEARRQAHLALGGMEQTRELHRETRGLPWLEQFSRDALFALRTFQRERGFTVVALSILAIGIGLNTGVFSLVNTVLLRPLPFADAERLVLISNGDPASVSRNELSNISSTVATWEALQETSQALEPIEAYDPFSVRHTFRLTSSSSDPETVLTVQVSPGLFPLLGMQPLLGRLLLPEDATPDAPPRTVLTHQLWSRRFHRDPTIIGSTIQINHRAVEVVGVLPPADPFTTVFFPAVRIDGYVPVVKERSRDWGNTLMLLGRIKPGLTPAQASADTLRAIEQIEASRPTNQPYVFANLTLVREWVAGNLRQPLLFLWIAAGLVLAIVGFNLGGLLLARGAARSREFAVRTALGAGRGRLARQLLTECFVLVAIGATLGGLIAWGGLTLLSARNGVEIPLLQNVRLDASALGFTVALCVVTVLLCGVAPALKLSGGGDLQHALKDESRGGSSGRAQVRVRSTLVILEVALACILAISAGLMVRSLVNLLRVDLGFAPDNLIAVRVDPVIAGDWPAHVNYLDALLERVRALPGVETAGLTDCIPVERDRSWSMYPIYPDSLEVQRWTSAHVRIVSPGLIGALGTTLLAGRDFTPADGTESPRVMVINRTLAHTFWPGEDAIGRQVNLGGRPITIIGVVADVRHAGPEVPSGNEFYLPLRQQGSGSWDLLVRTTLPVNVLTADLRQALRDIDPTLPLSKVRPVTELIDRTLSSRLLLVSLIGGFAAIALGLAALGLYGLISYSVTQRTREIGIRMALGADAALVQREVICDTLRLATFGLVLGLAGSLAAARLLQALLHGISAMDLPTYIVMTFGALVCALVAGYLPARRASRIDPMIALRAE
jgi:predicted permease